MNSIKSAFQEFDDWIVGEDPSSLSVRDRVSKDIAQLTDFCVVKPGHGQMELLEEGADLSEIYAKLGVPLLGKEKSPQEEYIVFNKMAFKENPENQRIIKNLGIVAEIISILTHRVTQQVSESEYYLKLIKQCYLFLIRFVRRSFQNQLTLYEQVDVFMKDIDRHPLSVYLIMEVFKDSAQNKQFLTLNTSKIIKQILTAAEAALNNAEFKASLYRVLQGFCKFQGKLIRQN